MQPRSLFTFMQCLGLCMYRYTWRRIWNAFKGITSSPWRFRLTCCVFYIQLPPRDKTHIIALLISSQFSLRKVPHAVVVFQPNHYCPPWPLKKLHFSSRKEEGTFLFYVLTESQRLNSCLQSLRKFICIFEFLAWFKIVDLITVALFLDFYYTFQIAHE